MNARGPREFCFGGRRVAKAWDQRAHGRQALALYQEQQLKKKRLEHVRLPDTWEALGV